jgi:hypothetical protein
VFLANGKGNIVCLEFEVLHSKSKCLMIKFNGFLLDENYFIDCAMQCKVIEVRKLILGGNFVAGAVGYDVSKKNARAI